MIDVQLDALVPTLLQHLAESGMIEVVLDDIAAGARAKWISLARQRLGNSRRDYIAGIQPIEVDDGGARVISLVGWLPNAIENGLEPFDMRKTLLGPGSRLTRVSASGKRYGHVPFRHGTPASGGATGKPMGRAYGPTGPQSRGLGDVMESDAAKKMGKAIYEAAKKVKATRTATYTSARSRGSITETKWGGRLPAGLAPKLAKHHTADIFAGMVRVRHTYERTTQTQYMTWRTISEANPEGWQHPGIEARNLANDVEAWIRDNGSKIAANALTQVLTGGTR